MKKATKLAAIAAILFAFLGASTLVAQEWTKEQKEVWQVVENQWENWQAKDIDGAFANIHENYLGWNDEMPMPTSKAKWMESMKKYAGMMSHEDYNIEPARIHVEGDAAVVHYYFSYQMDMGGEKKWMGYKGKWSEFYIKEDGEWMMIGDFTFSEPMKW